ncbi:hypothetical protein B4589_008025 [Halolamina sp. CBA1230]|uniref:hypothetical protein n=1 Tax=Halolamina sp. CBA1230 TaxID=1853690 RepID=UPI0009A14F30|nr:hypothetical protein [Halolamina sp. CBA1230]QKY20328.1 hypothetical protein B4589_008025 [Halolamina sp. CBA1230]
MKTAELLGTVLVAAGAALATSLVYTVPSAEAGGPAIVWLYGVILLRGGGGLLLAAVGYVTLSSGRVRLGATTLTASLVVVAVWLAIRFRLLRGLSMPAFTTLAVVVFLVAVGGVYRSFDR